MAANTVKRFRCPDHWTTAQRLNHYIDRSGGPDACWPWTGRRNKRGYGKTSASKTTTLAPRAIYETFIGPIPPGLCVLHRCDNPPCCNYESHFFLGTRDTNNKDMAAKGRNRRGADHHASKITADIVRAIRADTRRQRIIANDYGVNQGHVSAIKRRARWGHVD